MWAAPRLYWGVPCLCVWSLQVSTDGSAGRNNPVQPTTRVIPMRSGDFELHGTTDKRTNTRATTSETGVSELSHGGRTCGAVVDHNDPVERLLVNCAPRPLLAPTRERQYPEGRTCNRGCSNFRLIRTLICSEVVVECALLEPFRVSAARP